MASNSHLLEPLAALDREGEGVILIYDIHRAECPAVHLKGFAVQLRGIAVALIVGVGFYDGGIGEVLLNEGLHPLTGNDVGTVLLSGVEFYAHLSGNITAYFLIGGYEAFRRKITGEIHHGFFSVTLVIGDILVSVLNAGIVGGSAGCKDDGCNCKDRESFHNLMFMRIKIRIFCVTLKN